MNGLDQEKGLQDNKGFTVVALYVLTCPDGLVLMTGAPCCNLGSGGWFWMRLSWWPPPAVWRPR